MNSWLRTTNRSSSESHRYRLHPVNQSRLQQSVYQWGIDYSGESAITDVPAKRFFYTTLIFQEAAVVAIVILIAAAWAGVVDIIPININTGFIRDILIHIRTFYRRGMLFTTLGFCCHFNAAWRLEIFRILICQLQRGLSSGACWISSWSSIDDNCSRRIACCNCQVMDNDLRAWNKSCLSNSSWYSFVRSDKAKCSWLHT